MVIPRQNFKHLSPILIWDNHQREAYKTHYSNEKIHISPWIAWKFVTGFESNTPSSTHQSVLITQAFPERFHQSIQLELLNYPKLWWGQFSIIGREHIWSKSSTNSLWNDKSTMVPYQQIHQWFPSQRASNAKSVSKVWMMPSWSSHVLKHQLVVLNNTPLDTIMCDPYI